MSRGTTKSEQAKGRNSTICSAYGRDWTITGTPISSANACLRAKARQSHEDKQGEAIYRIYYTRSGLFRNRLLPHRQPSRARGDTSRRSFASAGGLEPVSFRAKTTSTNKRRPTLLPACARQLHRHFTGHRQLVLRMRTKAGTRQKLRRGRRCQTIPPALHRVVTLFDRRPLLSALRRVSFAFDTHPAKTCASSSHTVSVAHPTKHEYGCFVTLGLMTTRPSGRSPTKPETSSYLTN